MPEIDTDLEQQIQDLQGLASQPAVPTHPAAQFGAVLGGLGAAVGLGNPTMDAFQKQRQLELEQKMGSVKLGLQLRQMREKRQDTALSIYRDLLNSPSPEGRKMGATGIAAHLTSLGQAPLPGFVESFEGGTLSADQRKQAYISILAAENDPTLGANIDTYLERTLNLPKSMIPSLKLEARSEAVHRALYGQTLVQEREALAKADRDERRVFANEERLKLSEAREQRVIAENQQRLGFLERSANRADAQLALSEKKFEYMQAKGPEEKRLKALDQAELLANQLSAASVALDKLGYLPPPGASILDPNYLSARTKRIAFPNEPAWILWVRHLQPAMIGYARSVQNDIGPRAMAAFQGALTLMDNPPDLQSIQTVVENMRKAIRLGQKGEDTATSVLIKRPNGQVLRVPWKRGMEYAPGDVVVGIE